MSTPRIQPRQTVLFQGDSITDCGRSRDNDQDLGRGYANLVAAWFGVRHPEHHVAFRNRGISGNRACDLQERWERDCLDLAPDWVSILIGINDTWRRYDRDNPTSAQEFADAYADILERTRKHTEASIILLEPFVLPHPEDREAWREDLDPKIAAARALAREYACLYIPLDGVFSAAAVRRGPSSFWAADGVHPTPAGHALIARTWLQAVEAL